MFKKVLVMLSIFFIGSKAEGSDNIADYKVTPFSYQTDFQNQRSEQSIFDLIIPDCIEVPKNEIPGGSVLVDNPEIICYSCAALIGTCLCNYYYADSFLIPAAQSVYSSFCAYSLATKDKTNTAETSGPIALGHFVCLIGLPLFSYCATDSCVIGVAQPVLSLVAVVSVEPSIPSVLGLAGFIPCQRGPEILPQKMK